MGMSKYLLSKYLLLIACLAVFSVLAWLELWYVLYFLTIISFTSLFVVFRKSVQERDHKQILIERLTEIAPVGVCILDSNGRCVFMNQMGKMLLGYPDEQIFRGKILDLITSIEVAGNNLEQQIFSQEKTQFSEVELNGQGEKKIHVELGTQLMEYHGAVYGVAIYFKDLNDQKQLNLELQQRSEILKQVENITKSGSWLWDVELDIFSMSAEHKRLLGLEYCGGDIGREQFLSCIHLEDRELVQESLTVAVKSSDSFSLEYRVVKAGDNVRFLQCLGRAVYEGSAVTYLSGVCQDVTELREISSELYEAQRYHEALEELADERSEQLREALAKADRSSKVATLRFLTGMSHDLRTPLNSILGFAQLIQSKEKKSADLPQHKSGGAQILKSGKYLLQLISDIIDFAKIESGELQTDVEPTPLTSLIQEIVDISSTSAEKKRVEVLNSIVSENGGTWVMVDRSRLRQVLLNLITLIISCSPEGGKVKLEKGKLSFETISLKVIDSGLVIPVNRIAPLFTKRDDFDKIDARMHEMELRIAIAIRFIEQMHGGITFEKNFDEGNVFTIVLPTCAPIVKKQKKLPEQSSLLDEINVDDEKEYTLLYVEDNSANRQLVRSILRKKTNYRLIEAETGALGIQKAIEIRPQCVLMDIHLPDMTGFDALKSLKENALTAHIPVIAVSGKAEAVDLQKGLDAGFVEYVEKPLNVAVFRRVIAEVLATTSSCQSRVIEPIS